MGKSRKSRPTPVSRNQTLNDIKEYALNHKEEFLNKFGFLGVGPKSIKIDHDTFVSWDILQKDLDLTKKYDLNPYERDILLFSNKTLSKLFPKLRNYDSLEQSYRNGRMVNYY